MGLRICVAGVTGAVGKGITRAVLAAEDLELVGAVARSAAGRDVGEAVGGTRAGLAIRTTLAEALEAPTDILIDYTAPAAIKAHTLAALRRGIGVVIGTSGLTAAEFEEIDREARAAGVGAITGNFSLTATLLQRFALEAAQHLKAWEIIDYADAIKPDSPSATARELADRLSEVGAPTGSRRATDTIGPVEARGAGIAGTQVHSLRMPGFVFACEAIFGAPEERLVLRHEATSMATVFIAGTLLAARRLKSVTGLIRGFDRLLFPEPA
jgi:4-hydroxy-tetrahydrodipicolinate reductase